MAVAVNICVFKIDTAAVAYEFFSASLLSFFLLIVQVEDSLS
jgi:hypothetical protein